METYFGFVRTPVDAIKLFEACRLGQLPRVQRRLSEKERQSIRSGSVFVWDEREAGMRRWTDGKSWSASRVSGSFLTYREMEGKRGTGFANTRRSNGRTPESGRISDEDADGEPEGYRYKADGLMKQSFSITTSQGQHLHLISYYSRPHPGAPDMPQPSSDAALRHIIPAKGMYPESSLQDGNPPALTRTPMQPYSAANSPTEPPGYAYSWTASPTTSWSGGWPPSPSESPHWTAQGKLTPEMKHQPAPRLQQPVQRMPQHHAGHAQLPPPPTSAPIHTPPIYGKNTNPFEHERLPTSQPASRHPPAIHTSHYSPHTQHLQLQAQAVMVDPRMAPTSARNPQGPLPAMGPRLTPPRTASVSPPRATSSDGPNSINKASLSALLHPTPASSEPSSANPMNPSSACSSPRIMTSAPGPLPPASDLMREDVKALRQLDRKFCI